MGDRCADRADFAACHRGIPAALAVLRLVRHAPHRGCLAQPAVPHRTERARTVSGAYVRLWARFRQAVRQLGGDPHGGLSRGGPFAPHHRRSERSEAALSCLSDLRLTHVLHAAQLRYAGRYQLPALRRARDAAVDRGAQRRGRTAELQSDHFRPPRGAHLERPQYALPLAVRWQHPQSRDGPAAGVPTRRISQPVGPEAVLPLWAALRYRAAAVLSQDRARRAGIFRCAGLPRHVARGRERVAEHERSQFRQSAQGCEPLPRARYVPRTGLRGQRLRRPREPGVLPVPRADLLNWRKSLPAICAASHLTGFDPAAQGTALGRSRICFHDMDSPCPYGISCARLKTAGHQSQSKGSRMKFTRCGLDIAKQVFQVHGVNEHGVATGRKSLPRGKVLEFFVQLPPCLIGIEACGSAHYWARELSKLGHAVRLMAPQYVAAYRKRGKNDANDAEAICEAVGRPNMRFVPIKSQEQQAVLMVHRARTLTMANRVAQVNQIRGLLGEFGVVVPKGVGRLRRELPGILEDAENGLPVLAREVLCGLLEQLREADMRISAYDRQIRALAEASEPARRLMQIESIGPQNATALVA